MQYIEHVDPYLDANHAAGRFGLSVLQLVALTDEGAVRHHPRQPFGWRGYLAEELAADLEVIGILVPPGAVPAKTTGLCSPGSQPRSHAQMIEALNLRSRPIPDAIRNPGDPLGWIRGAIEALKRGDEAEAARCNERLAALPWAKRVDGQVITCAWCVVRVEPGEDPDVGEPESPDDPAVILSETWGIPELAWSAELIQAAHQGDHERIEVCRNRLKRFGFDLAEAPVNQAGARQSQAYQDPESSAALAAKAFALREERPPLIPGVSGPALLDAGVERRLRDQGQNSDQPASSTGPVPDIDGLAEALIRRVAAELIALGWRPPE
jgi:hypothetical protein